LIDRIHYTSCPGCSAVNLRSVLEVKDFSVTGQLFSLLQCQECELRFTQDVPDASAIAPYYQFEQYISHTNTNKGLVNKLYQGVRKFTLRQKRKLIEKASGCNAGLLLDVGCGTGAFAASMQQAGWTVTALEPDAGARKIAMEQFGVQAVDSAQLYQLPEAHYDVITLWHVLEHMHQLQQVIVQLRKLLKPSGQLIIAVPNYTSFDAVTFGEYWAAYDVPRHLYHFSPRSMRALLSAHQLVLTETFPMWFDSFYVSLLSTAYRSGRTDYAKAFLTGLASNLRALADTEKCSSIIYCCRQWPH
jgi:2-polyprenyl-3-methyl-5-hydroxy-6-metoxy-1,4-benzoquinol methylase